MPQIKNLSGGTLVGCSLLCGFVFGSDIATTYNTLRTNNDSLLLNVGERTRKYVNTLGSNGWHASADTSNIGVFGVASSVNTTLIQFQVVLLLLRYFNKVLIMGF